MTYAAITGWGKCLPPAILSNDDLATFLDTDDEWIRSRTGMVERRVSHVDLQELAYVSAARALACAGKTAEDVELIVMGTCSADELVPNVASGIQKKLGAVNAACMDVNTACTSFLYALSSANAMIRTGVVKSALVLGGEVISKAMEWTNRDVSVLFGDGCAAVYLEATENREGLLAESLGCFGDVREILALHGHGTKYYHTGRKNGEIEWNFIGPEIFKKAVAGMAKACADVLAKLDMTTDDVDLVVPHQANLRIIDAVAKRAGVEKERVFVNVHRYGNMSAATLPVALVESIEDGFMKPGSRVLAPAFGAGLTWCSHLIKWGDRVTPLGETDIDLPPCDKTGLELVQEIMAASS
ncbi:MAG: ketoacyl-ACP synthase III [Pseudomonadales bacterium]